MSLSGYSVIRPIEKTMYGDILLLRCGDEGRDDKTYVGKSLKKLPTNGRYLKILKNEVDILKRVQGGPFMIKFFSKHEDEEQMLLVLDHLRVRDLHALWKQRKFTEEEVKFFAAEILIGIDYLHSVGVIHKDIKPSNIGIDGEGHIAIFDFGLSELFDSAGMKRFTRTGTKYFMAPEVKQLTQSGYDQSVDYYSYGVTILSLLSKEFEFCGDAEELNHLVSKLTHSVFSATAGNLIKELISKDPEKRLGGGGRGAEEIKKHPFFEEMDFEQVKARALTPPPCCYTTL